MNAKQFTLFRMPFTTPYRRTSVVLLLAEVAIIILRCVTPLCQRSLVDAANAGIIRRCVEFACLLGAMMLCSHGAGILAQWKYGTLSIALRQHLKAEVFRHLLQLPEDFLRSRGAGYFFNRVQNDIGHMVVFWASRGISLYVNFLELLLGMATLYFIDWRHVLLGIPFLCLQFLLCLAFRKQQYAYAGKMQESVATQRHLMQEYLERHVAVKTHTAVQSAGEKIKKGLSDWGQLARKRLRLDMLFRFCLQVPSWLCLAIVLILGIYDLHNGQGTLGDLWAKLALLRLLFTPAQALGGSLSQLEEARSASERLKELLEVSIEDTDADTDAFQALSLKGDILIQGLHFRHDASERELFQGLELRIPAGDRLFITGSNGSGKSTLLSLLLRLYLPKQGAISIGGKNIQDFPLGAYRRRIGYLGQHPEFIPGTLRDNLLFGNPPCDDATILETMRRLGCQRLVENRSAGLGATVTANAENFSGGERLRMALVREMLRDTDILLFDEAAAHLDLEGRQEFYQLIQKLPADRTVIAVVHGTPDIPEAKVFTLQDARPEEKSIE